MWYFHLCSSFSRLFWLFEAFCFCTILELLVLLCVCEKCHCYFDRHCIKSVDILGYYGHFNNISFSNPQMQYIFPSVYVLFNFLHQCSIIFWVQFFYLSRFIPRHFILDVFVNFLKISLSDRLFLMYRNATDICGLILYPTTLINSLMRFSSVWWHL